MKTLFFALFIVLIFNNSNGQQLNLLIEEALENNPEIQVFELKYKLAKEKINQVNSFPNTEVAFGYFVSETETRTGAQQFKVSAKQNLPYFGVITARENYEKSLANAVYEDITITKRKLIVSVSQSYYNLYALKEKQEALSKNIELLKTYEALALTYIEVGKASVVDLLRIQIKQNELEQSKQVLEQDYLYEQTVLSNLLNREKKVEFFIEAQLTISPENNFYNSANLSFHPELLKFDKLYESVEKSELLNKKESKPMFGFGLDYIAVSERPNMSFNDNGKDIIMPTVSVSIPVFNKKYKSKSIQNNLYQKEIKAQKENRLNTLQNLLDKAIKKSNSARINYNTQTKNLKQSKDAEAILLKNYETGTIDFMSVLEIQELQLKFQINQIESIKNYYLQTIIIKYLTK